MLQDLPFAVAVVVLQSIVDVVEATGDDHRYFEMPEDWSWMSATMLCQDRERQAADTMTLDGRWLAEDSLYVAR
jgi:hypothetical protein